MALELRTGCATSAGACGLRRVTDKKRKENGEPLGAAAIRFAADPGVIYNGPPRRGRGRPGGTVLRWPGLAEQREVRAYVEQHRAVWRCAREQITTLEAARAQQQRTSFADALRRLRTIPGGAGPPSSDCSRALPTEPHSVRQPRSGARPGRSAAWDRRPAVPGISPGTPDHALCAASLWKGRRADRTPSGRIPRFKTLSLLGPDKPPDLEVLTVRRGPGYGAVTSLRDHLRFLRNVN